MVNTNNPYNLTNDQYNIFQELINFCKTPFGGCYLLSGYAGVGKTYLLSKLVTELKNEKLICSSPTHKSLKVLRTTTGISFRGVTFATVHSALGLREKIDGFGNVKFEPDPKADCKVDNTKYMIVDEASMINNDLFHRLMSFVENNNLKLIFVGDPVQIPPVNDSDSLPFKPEIQTKYGIKKLELNEIIRQQNGHPIINKSLEIRHNLNNKNAFLERKDIVNQSGGVFYHDRKKIKDKKLKSLLTGYFDTEDFTKNVDYARVIAWTNKEVDQYNDLVRKLIYKKDTLPKIMIGEKLIISSPILKNDRVVLNTNDEVEVIGYKIKYEEIKGVDKFIKYYDTIVKFETIHFGDIQHNIRIIHEDDEKEFENISELVKQVALSEIQGTEKAKMMWIMYYTVKQYFAKVQYGYSITAHKSQGSTYTNTVIIENDINKNPNVVEKNRILYTAITRSSNNCHIIY